MGLVSISFQVGLFVNMLTLFRFISQLFLIAVYTHSQLTGTIDVVEF